MTRAGCVAVVAFVVACGRDRPGPRPIGAVIDSLIRVGEVHFVAERFDSAQTTWRAALRASRTAGEPAAAARSLSQLGLVAWQQGDLEEAGTLARQSLDTGQGLGSAAEPARPHLVLGLVALDGGHNREAIAHFETAVDAARATGDSAMIARAMGGLGNAYTYLGDLARGREYQRVQRQLGRLIGNPRIEGNGLLNEAMIDIWQGDPRPAIARIDTARSLYRTGGFGVGEQHALGQLATAYERTGEDDRALSVLDSALAIDRRLGLRQEEADQLRLIGEIHARLGDYRHALDYYLRAETAMRDQGLGGNLGAVLRGQAIVQAHLGDQRQAARAAEEALRIHTASDEPLDRLDDLLLLAEIESLSGNRQAVAARIDEARRVANAVNTRGALFAVTLAEAQLSDRAGDAMAVLRALDRGAGLPGGGDDGAAWLADGLAARAYAKLGIIDSAIVAGRRAVRATEQVRGRLGAEGLRANLIAARASVYGDLALALLRAGQSAEAFSIADGARSRELLERLAATRADSGSATAAFLAGEHLLRRIDSLIQRLRETAPARPRERGTEVAGEDGQLTVALAAARGEYEVTLAREIQRMPHGAGLLGLAPVTLGAVQRALGPGQALLEYLIVGDALLTFVVTQGELRVFTKAASTATLTERARLVHDIWGARRPDWRRALPAAQALRETLVDSVISSGALEGVHDLLIVPHGVLGQLPFAALPNRAGRFLVEDFSVIHLPSAGALVALASRRSPGPLTLGGEVFAPFPDGLPASRAEVAGIQATIPGTTARIGTAATEGAIRRALAQPGFVHLASHGVLNARNPLFSGMELVRTADRPEGDGRLEAYEILGLTIRSTLVFFSGCETGARREWTDDPVLGTSDLTLAQAVLVAGAGNVVTTLWRIDDAGAAAFADQFYRRLRSSSLLDALAGAQRATIANPQYGSPYYWASYVLSGPAPPGARIAGNIRQ